MLSLNHHQQFYLQITTSTSFYVKCDFPFTLFSFLFPSFSRKTYIFSTQLGYFWCFHGIQGFCEKSRDFVGLNQGLRLAGLVSMIMTVTAAATVAALIQSESILEATMTAMMIRKTVMQKSWVTKWLTFVSPYAMHEMLRENFKLARTEKTTRSPARTFFPHRRNSVSFTSTQS